MSMERPRNADSTTVVRDYYSFAGSTFEEFLEHSRRLVHPSIVWIDHGNPDGVHGIEGLVAEFERVHALGVEYLTFEVLHLAVDGDTVFTQRLEHIHGADGRVLTTLDILGVNRVRDDRIVYGKDHYFDTSRYSATWFGAETPPSSP